ncbi:MAG: hypothetical protein K6G28_02030 [Acholeplasmatales bacterium]|nr:hypothetical protein [Acholeplasmatales bacterium]
MMPIRYEIKNEEETIIINDFENLESGYNLEKQFNFMPDFLEKVMPNNTSNISIQHYVNIKDNFRYIGTVKHNKEANQVIEYYQTDDGMIAYLVNTPKRYYPSVQAVAIFKRKVNEVS